MPTRLRALQNLASKTPLRLADFPPISVKSRDVAATRSGTKGRRARNMHLRLRSYSTEEIGNALRRNPGE